MQPVLAGYSPPRVGQPVWIFPSEREGFPHNGHVKSRAREALSRICRPDVAGTTPAVTPMATNVTSQSSDGQKDCVVALVKRGDTLWQMARHCYGDGTKYSKIFQSNRQQIRNPNLIYPDQQLALPH